MNKKVIILLATIVLLLSGSAMYHLLTTESEDSDFEKISAEVAQEQTAKKENIIIFYSFKECDSCRMYSPILKDVASKLGINVYQLESQAEKTTESKSKFIKNNNLYSTPTLLLFKDGEVTRFEGILTEEETEHALMEWRK